MIETLWKWVWVSSGMLAEYLAFTSLVFLMLYVWRKKNIWYAKIQQRYPDNKQLKREIKYSVYSLFISGVVILLVSWANKHHWTQAYKPIDKYGWGYYVLSFFIMMIVHDTYFYWTHRLMHWKKIFKYVHLTHHLSTNPTPFSAQAFHPVEGLLQVGIIPVIAFTIPHHVSMITIFISYSTILNVMGHCGFEFFPKTFTRHKIFKWHNAATHHNMHHKHFNNNFGLYFNFWDRVMKTNHPNYEAYHEKVVNEREQRKLAFKSAMLPARKIEEPVEEYTNAVG